MKLRPLFLFLQSSKKSCHHCQRQRLHPMSTSSPSLAPQGPHPDVPEVEKRTPLPRFGGKPWKDAASLILAAPSPEDNNKTEFLVMKRSKGSTFAPGTLCFPGGVLCPADMDQGWFDLFKTTTAADLREVSFSKDGAQIPPIYSPNKKKVESMRELFKFVPPQVALRIAAIRETFEECGILIVRKNLVEEAGSGVGREGKLGMGYTAGTLVLPNPDEVEEWQGKVRKDPFQFLKMCHEYTIRPDLNALVEWSNYLTPNSFGARRFDTIFYMTVVPHTLPFLSDEYEVASVRWTSPEKVLQGAKDKKARLIPPQIYELTRLRDTTTEKIQQLMRMRLNLGVERWCPCYFKVKDGIISVFPGDDLYPDIYKIEEFEEIRELDQTVEEARSSTKRHHRIEFKSEFEFQMVINIGPRLGHIYTK